MRIQHETFVGCELKCSIMQRNALHYHKNIVILACKTCRLEFNYEKMFRENTGVSKRGFCASAGTLKKTLFISRYAKAAFFLENKIYNYNENIHFGPCIYL